MQWLYCDNCVSTTEGKLQKLYSRNKFDVYKDSLAHIEMVSKTSSISLREATQKFVSIFTYNHKFKVYHYFLLFLFIRIKKFNTYIEIHKYK